MKNILAALLVAVSLMMTACANLKDKMDTESGTCADLKRQMVILKTSNSFSEKAGNKIKIKELNKKLRRNQCQ